MARLDAEMHSGIRVPLCLILIHGHYGVTAIWFCDSQPVVSTLQFKLLLRHVPHSDFTIQYGHAEPIIYGLSLSPHSSLAVGVHIMSGPECPAT